MDNPSSEWSKHDLSRPGRDTQPSDSEFNQQGLPPVHAFIEDLGSSGFVVHRRYVQNPLGRSVHVWQSLNESTPLRGIGQVLSQNPHPGIQRIHIGTTEMLMCADIAGTPLSDLLKHKEIKLTDSVKVLVKTAEALHHVHMAGLLHRDCKPAHIYVGSYGEVILGGWGCAVVQPSREDSLPLPPHLTPERIAMGSPAYIAPEAARGEQDSISVGVDIFSLGAILHEILLGSPPYQGAGKQALQLAATGSCKIPIQEEINREALAEIARKALNLNPIARGNAQQFAANLEGWLLQTDRLESLQELVAETKNEFTELLSSNTPVAAWVTTARVKLDEFRDILNLSPQARDLETSLVEAVIYQLTESGDLLHAADMLSTLPAGTSPGQATQTLKIAERQKQQNLRRAKWITISAIIIVISVIALNAWLSISSEKRAENERQRIGQKIWESIEAWEESPPTTPDAWQTIIMQGHQALGLSNGKYITEVETLTVKGISWSLDTGRLDLARAWAGSFLAISPSTQIDLLRDEVIQNYNDRRTQRELLLEKFTDIIDNPWSVHDEDWWQWWRNNLSALPDKDFVQCHRQLRNSNNVQLVRLAIALSTDRPQLVNVQILSELAQHNHPAISLEALRALAAREEPQVLPLLVSRLEKQSDFFDTLRLAQQIGPWALPLINSLPHARDRAVLGILLRGDIDRYRQEALHSAIFNRQNWPLGGMAAVALKDRNMLIQWVGGESNRVDSDPWQRISSLAVKTQLQEARSSDWFWLHYWGHPTNSLPAFESLAGGNSDFDHWQGLLGYAADVLENEHPHAVNSLNALRARSRLAVGPLEHLIHQARNNEDQARLEVLRNIHRLMQPELEQSELP